MTKDQARTSVMESGVFGKEFVPIWESTYADGQDPMVDRMREAVTDTIHILVDQYLIDEGVAYEMYEITVVSHAFVEYTGFVME